MKVGIITVHSVPNYGAVLQAYALATYLREREIDAETIDYRQPDLEELYRMRWRIPPPIKHWLRLRKNTQFVENQLPLSPKRYHSVNEFLPDVKNYDAFITGSDQVWFTGPVQGYDPMYFLDFPAPGKRKISYAASVGGTTDFAESREKVARAVADIGYPGVRDAHTSSMVEPFASRPPTQVVDPTFLCDFEKLLREGKEPTEPYLLVFGNFSGALSPVLRSIIRRTGLKKIVSLQYPCADATHRVAAPSPTEWLNYFRHASFVVTSYFHGTAIAAKFSRPFLSIPTPGRRIKVATMLDWIGIPDRAVTTPDPDAGLCADLATQPIDWSVAQRNIREQTALSEAFLDSALS
jgi:hypothetical protein